VAGRRRRAAGQGVHGHSQRLRRGVTLAPEMRCSRRRFLPPCPGQKVPARIARDTHPNASLPHPHPLPECSRCRASSTCCTAPAGDGLLHRYRSTQLTSRGNPLNCGDLVVGI
jgi:hypothetical protein